MTPVRAFTRAVGARLLHVTSRSNLPGIKRHGLLPPAELTRMAGHSETDIILRKSRVALRLSDGSLANLTHQRPILHGLGAAARLLDAHTPESCALQLDRRVFFWPERRGARFAKSIERDAQIACLWFDAARLFELHADALWLSPINSGNFLQGGATARRGDWIYCLASDGMDHFRANRTRRGLRHSADTVAELSMIGGLPLTSLTETLLDITMSGEDPHA